MPEEQTAALLAWATAAAPLAGRPSSQPHGPGSSLSNLRRDLDKACISTKLLPDPLIRDRSIHTAILDRPVPKIVETCAFVSMFVMSICSCSYVHIAAVPSAILYRACTQTDEIVSVSINLVSCTSRWAHTWAGFSYFSFFCLTKSFLTKKK
jgi:energy-converting hydrogenase Eha subunit C